MATKKTTKKSGTTVKSLEKEVADLKKIIESFSKASMPIQSMVSTNQERDDVVFISLCPEMLNLTANVNGNLIVETFNSFGEEHTVSYADARALVKGSARFINEGAVYIDDEDFIKNEKLTKYYKNILSKDELLDLLSVDKTTFTSKYNNMPQMQKDIFARLVTYKVIKGEDVDMNIVQAINTALKIDILGDINNGKDLMTQGK
jgi:hypothetical protein